MACKPKFERCYLGLGLGLEEREHQRFKLNPHKDTKIRSNNDDEEADIPHLSGQNQQTSPNLTQMHAWGLKNVHTADAMNVYFLTFVGMIHRQRVKTKQKLWPEKYSRG